MIIRKSKKNNISIELASASVIDQHVDLTIDIIKSILELPPEAVGVSDYTDMESLQLITRIVKNTKKHFGIEIKKDQFNPLFLKDYVLFIVSESEKQNKI